MGAYPRVETREGVLELMNNSGNTIDQSVFDDFNSLPNEIFKDKDVYHLSLGMTWYSVEPSHYNFEFNYYNAKSFKTLLKYKAFDDIVDSIKYLKDNI